MSRHLEYFNSLNHNVKVALTYTGFSSFAVGIWGSTVLSGYLKVLTGTNTKVGLAEGIQGACQVISAFPAGMIADKFRRDRVLKAASTIGQVSLVAILFALFFKSIFGGHDGKYDDNVSFVLICVGLGIWGCFVGMSNAPLEALFADSTTDEERPKMNQLKFSLLLASGSSGPLTSIALFWFVGDRWTPNELRTVFCVGVVLMIPSLWMLYSFDDNKTIKKTKQEVTATIDEDRVNEELIEPLIGGDDEHVEANDLTSKENDSDEEENAKYSTPRYYWVPRIIVGTDLMAGFASGMTIKFFPLFFKEESQMSPAEVSFLVFLSYMGISSFSYMARALSKKLGTVTTIMMFQVPGTFLLMIIYFMSVGYDIKKPGQVPLWRNKLLIGSIYVLRSSLMNSPRPLKRAILMEHVPSSSRGTWSAFESLTKFGWSGSAVFGGYLMDTYGYGFTFLATACIQLSYSLLQGLMKIYID